MGAQEGGLFRGPRGRCRHPSGLCPVSKPRHTPPPIPGKLLILEVAGLLATLRESLHFPGDSDVEACGPYCEHCCFSCQHSFHGLQSGHSNTYSHLESQGVL